MRRKKEDSKMKMRTDLALETREQFEKDQVEVDGVILRKQRYANGAICVTSMKITNRKAQKIMERPIGTYITMEMEKDFLWDAAMHEEIVPVLAGIIRRIGSLTKEQPVLVVGLGNRDVTPDSLGPRVVDRIMVTRHFEKEFGREYLQEQSFGRVSAIAPGVMGQTGMEILEILQGVIRETKPEVVLIIDALAARSTERVNTTIQITDTGICPGAGIGNHRQALDKESLGVRVVAIGVPTVVDAVTIILDGLERAMQHRGGKEDAEAIVKALDQDGMRDMFVTPKNIDESVQLLALMIAEGINQSIMGCPDS